MNLAYLVIPIIVGLVIGTSVFIVQNANLTGYTVSPTLQASLSNETQQTTLENETKCPTSCDDTNPCTIDWCNETSNYLCSHTPLNGTSEGCWGNPTICSTNLCVSGKCTELQLAKCCGNNICDSNESCSLCPNDCGECPPLLSETTIQSTQTSTSQSTESSQTSTTSQLNETQNITLLNHIIINEIATNGPNGSYDEFVELYNPTDADVSIAGWKLQYKSATGDTWQSKVGLGLSGIIKTKSFYLLASKGYTLNTQPDYLHTANWGLSDTGGHVRIIDANVNVIDKVGYGNANEPEGSPAPALESGKSLQRKSPNTDTDNNSQDFELTLPSPKNSTNQ